MILIDTSVWIEFLKGNSAYTSRITAILEQGLGYACEPVFGELLQGAKNRRETEIIRRYWENLPRIEIPDLFIQGGLYSQKKKLLSHGVGLIDALLLVLAEEADCRIWTLDKKLLRVIPKHRVYNS